MQLFNPLDSRVIPLDCLQLSRMVSAYERGATSRSLAKRYGMSQKAVLRRLLAMGVVIRRAGSRYESDRLRGER